MVVREKYNIDPVFKEIHIPQTQDNISKNVSKYTF